jgi:hypothetical protein
MAFIKGWDGEVTTTNPLPHDGNHEIYMYRTAKSGQAALPCKEAVAHRCERWEVVSQLEEALVA